jgi:hypothetical protein
MPKRVIDAEAVWRSKKLAQVQPAWIKFHFPWLLGLARANGVFELDIRAIWAQAYSYYFPDVTVEQVAEIFAEFIRVKLVFTWTIGEKTWAFWVGSTKSGRLPPRSRVQAGHEILGPEPPCEELARFLGNEPVSANETDHASDERAQPKEAEDHPQSEGQSDAGVESGARSRSPKCGSRFPETFAVADEHRVLARELGVDADAEFPRFADYWRGRPGREGVKLDWSATFRNWLRKAADFRSGKPVEARGGSSSKKRSAEPNYSDMAKTPDWAKE